MDQPVQQAEAAPARDGGTPWRLLGLLICITAIGPTTLNILVPALPNLAKALGTDVDTVQLAVSLYLIGLASAQLLAGPLSDRFGRRPVALGGLALTAVTSLAALAVGDVAGLIVVRIVQAVGAASGIVVARAIVRDLFERDRAAAMLGLVTTAMVIAPTFGPLIGGLLETAFGWKSIFLFVAAASLTVLAWAAAVLPETRRREAGGAAATGFGGDLLALARSASFHGYVLCAAFGSGTFFVFLGGGPHAVVTIMGRSPAEFGVWFALSSVGFMAGNFLTSRLSMRYGVDRMIRWGLGIEALGAIGAIVLAAFAHRVGAGDHLHSPAGDGHRQRCDAAERDRRRGQHPAAGGRHRVRLPRLYPDDDRRRLRAARRPRAGGRHHGAADGAAARRRRGRVCARRCSALVRPRLSAA